MKLSTWTAAVAFGLTGLVAMNVTQATVIKSETFDTAGTVADYTGAGKIFVANTLQSADATVSGGVLHQNASNSQTSNSNAGTMISLGGPQDFAYVQFDLTPKSYGSGGFALYLGKYNDNFDGSGGFSSWNTQDYNRNLVRIQFANGDNTQLGTASIYGSAQAAAYTTAAFPVNQSHTFRVVVNNTIDSKGYQGPDNAAHTINAKSFAVYLDSGLIVDNVANGTGGAAPGGLANVVFLSNRNWSGAKSQTDIDNISIVSIPEPASMGLLAIGGLTLLARRRRV